jgi:hypothetical protein
MSDVYVNVNAAYHASAFQRRRGRDAIHEVHEPFSSEAAMTDLLAHGTHTNAPRNTAWQFGQVVIDRLPAAARRLPRPGKRSCGKLR